MFGTLHLIIVRMVKLPDEIKLLMLVKFADIKEFAKLENVGCTEQDATLVHIQHLYNCAGHHHIKARCRSHRGAQSIVTDVHAIISRPQLAQELLFCRTTLFKTHRWAMFLIKHYPSSLNLKCCVSLPSQLG